MTLSIGTLREHLNITDATDDALLTRLLASARLQVERHLGSPLVATSRTLSLDAFPAGILTLPQGPVTSVTSIAYYTSAGSSTPLDGSAWRADTASDPARIEPVTSWPATQARINAVTVTYLAGWSADEDNVPADLQEAVLLLAAHWYENREASVVGVSAGELPFGVCEIVDQRRNYSFGVYGG